MSSDNTPRSTMIDPLVAGFHDLASLLDFSACSPTKVQPEVILADAPEKVNAKRSKTILTDVEVLRDDVCIERASSVPESQTMQQADATDSCIMRPAPAPSLSKASSLSKVIRRPTRSPSPARGRSNGRPESSSANSATADSLDTSFKAEERSIWTQIRAASPSRNPQTGVSAKFRKAASMQGQTRVAKHAG